MKVGFEAPPRPGVLVDPRIRQRRVEVRRTEGRHRLRVLLALLGATALLAAAWGVTRLPLLDVDRVVVDGGARTGVTAVRVASGLERGRPMVDVDEQASVRGVAELPWVLSATARREWPSTVRIHVTERTLVAVTSDDAGGWAAVDVAGRVLERSAAAPADVPVLEGTPAAGAPGTRLAPGAGGALLVASALWPHLGPRVAAVVAVDGGVELRLRPGGVVTLGLPDALEAKLVAVTTVLSSVDPRTVASLDVRLPSSPVLTRR